MERQRQGGGREDARRWLWKDWKDEPGNQGDKKGHDSKGCQTDSVVTSCIRGTWFVAKIDEFALAKFHKVA